MPRSLRYYGDPILRQQAKAVTVFDAQLQSLAKEMVATMDAHRGLGLAAPQVGVSLQLFVIRNDLLDLDAPASDLQYYINPRLIHLSRRQVFAVEGCLSIPGLEEAVWRPDGVAVEAYDLQGSSFRATLQGIAARVLLHEYDHLQGVLFIDRLQKKVRRRLQQQLTVVQHRHAPQTRESL